MKKIGYYSYQSHFDHDVGDDHPEHPFRILAIESQLEQSALAEHIEYHEGNYPDQQDLELAHTSGYLDQLEQVTPEQGHIYIDNDTPFAPGSLHAAYRASGCVLQALNDLTNKRYDFSFCAVRPPGHHAQRNKAMGFCFLNHVAIATLKATKKLGYQKVMVIDFDVHQANGTIDILGGKDNCQVLTSFQHPYYPNSHWQDEFDNVINTPLDAGCDSSTFRKLIRQQWLEKINSYQADLVIVSAGFDAHQADPNGEVELQSDDYLWLAKLILDNKPQTTPVLAVLEGGYDLQALAESVEMFLTPFCQDS